MKNIYRWTIGLVCASLILWSCLLMFRLTLPYFSFRYDIDFLLTKQRILHLTAWRWSFYIHISTSLIVLFLGLFQFNRTLLNRYPTFHKLSGKIYIGMILFLCAPSGLVMAFYANGGLFAKTSFVLTASLWWLFTFIAYLKITKGKVEKHIQFMVRSYALTLSAITLRTYVLFLPAFIHLPAKNMYTLVAWLSWIPNLLIAEIIIKKKIFR